MTTRRVFYGSGSVAGKSSAKSAAGKPSTKPALAPHLVVLRCWPNGEVTAHPDFQDACGADARTTHHTPELHGGSVMSWTMSDGSVIVRGPANGCELPIPRDVRHIPATAPRPPGPRHWFGLYIPAVFGWVCFVALIAGYAK